MESSDQLSTLSSILDSLATSKNETALIAERIAVRFLRQRLGTHHKQGKRRRS
jgi:hypothetical protein